MRTCTTYTSESDAPKSVLDFRAAADAANLAGLGQERIARTSAAEKSPAPAGSDSAAKTVVRRLMAASIAGNALASDLYFPYSVLDVDTGSKWAHETYARVTRAGEYIHTLRLSSIGNDAGGYAQLSMRSLGFLPFEAPSAAGQLVLEAAFQCVSTLSAVTANDAPGFSNGFGAVRSWLFLHLLPDLQSGDLVESLFRGAPASLGGSLQIPLPMDALAYVRMSLPQLAAGSRYWAGIELRHYLQCGSSNTYSNAACSYVLRLESVQLHEVVIE